METAASCEARLAPKPYSTNPETAKRGLFPDRPPTTRKLQEEPHKLSFPWPLADQKERVKTGLACHSSTAWSCQCLQFADLHRGFSLYMRRHY